MIRSLPRCECSHAHRVHARGECDHKRRSCADIDCEQTRCNVAFCGCTSYRAVWPKPIKAAPKRIRRSPIPRKARAKVMPKCKCGHKERTHYLDGAPSSCRRCTCAKYKAKRIPANKKPRGMKDSDLGRAKRTLWKRFSAYVKARDGNACFTCDQHAEKGKLQAGHMFPGRTGALLFDPLVVFSQCADCNRGKRGNTPEFVRRYVERFGIEQFQAAVARTSRDKQWRTPEVRELIAVLRERPDQYEAVYMEKHGLPAVGGA